MEIFLFILDGFEGLDDIFAVDVPDIDDVVGVDDDDLVLLFVNEHVNYGTRVRSGGDVDYFVGEDVVEHEFAIK